MQKKSEGKIFDKYVLDSYALLAFLSNEKGRDLVENLFILATEKKVQLYMSIINFGEVIYIIEREEGLRNAQLTLARISKLPVKLVDADLHLTLKASHIKASNTLSFADAFAASLALEKNASLITGDKEFASISEKINIIWI
ncbi:MAG: type II toxin-antitoxin system VapC family toxin [Actinobacteria bacterium]|nr:type II toxin-antitoxin system VapC family toxin [Actinomycetota bacterium]